MLTWLCCPGLLQTVDIGLGVLVCLFSMHCSTSIQCKFIPKQRQRKAKGHAFEAQFIRNSLTFNGSSHRLFVYRIDKIINILGHSSHSESQIFSWEISWSSDYKDSCYPCLDILTHGLLKKHAMLPSQSIIVSTLILLLLTRGQDRHCHFTWVIWLTHDIRCSSTRRIYRMSRLT